MNKKERTFQEPDQEVVEFLTRIEGIINRGDLQTEEDVEGMVDSVLNEIESDVQRISGNPVCSRVLERVLALAADTQTCRFAQMLCGSYLHLAPSMFSSHVLQSLLVGLSRALRTHTDAQAQHQSEPTDEDAAAIEVHAHSLMEEICGELNGNWVNVMFNRFSTHVFRSLMRALVGGEAHKTAATSIASGGGGSSTAQQLDADIDTQIQSLVTWHTATLDLPASQQTQATQRLESMCRAVQVVVGEIIEASQEQEWEETRHNAQAAASLQALLVSLCAAQRACESVVAQHTAESSTKKDEARAAVRETLTALESLAVSYNASLTSLCKVVLELPQTHRLGTAFTHEQTAQMQTAMETVAGSRTMEVVIACAPDDLWCDLLTWVVTPRAAHLAGHTQANFVLQRCIARANAPQLRALVQPLLDIVFELLSANRAGVVWRLAQACAKHDMEQKAFMRAFLPALKKLNAAKNGNATEDSSDAPKAQPKQAVWDTHSGELLFAIVAIGAAPSDHWHHNKQRHQKQPGAAEAQQHKHVLVGVIGSLIAQALVSFDPRYTTDLMASFVGCVGDQLAGLCIIPAGSRLVEAFMTSNTVERTHKNKLISRLKGQFLALARHQTGSRCVECLYLNGDVTSKELIAKELCGYITELSSSRHGAFVVRTCKLQMFLQKHQQWVALHQKQSKMAQMFDDITAHKGVQANKKEMRLLGFSSAQHDADAVAETAEPVETRDSELDAIFNKTKKKNLKEKRKLKAQAKSVETSTTHTSTEDHSTTKTEEQAKKSQTPQATHEPADNDAEKTKKKKKKNKQSQDTDAEPTSVQEQQGPGELQFVLDALVSGTHQKKTKKRKSKDKSHKDDSDSEAPKRKRKFAMA